MYYLILIKNKKEILEYKDSNLIYFIRYELIPSFFQNEIVLNEFFKDLNFELKINDIIAPL